MSMRERIVERLMEGLEPSFVDVADESALHAGHAGAREGGETHFRVRIVSEKFEGLGQVARHRKVYALLGREFADGVHALALQTLTPGEQ